MFVITSNYNQSITRDRAYYKNRYCQKQNSEISDLFQSYQSDGRVEVSNTDKLE